MTELDYRNYIIGLFDIYQDLLTEKQIEYFTSYYFEDLSLFEIADNLSISRNAVFDQIKRSEKALEGYEEKLHLFEKKKKIENIINQIKKENDFEKLDNIMQIIKE